MKKIGDFNFRKIVNCEFRVDDKRCGNAPEALAWYGEDPENKFYLCEKHMNLLIGEMVGVNFPED